MSHPPVLRPDLQLVADQIFPFSRVLDLGCGPGKLLDYLRRTKECAVTGVDTDPDAVVQAIRRGVPVLERDVEEALLDIADDSYDTVVLSRTLQTIVRPAVVLREMGRVAERLIVSVPNFGYYENRLRLLRGRMPMSKELPYEWYDTPNLRFTTLRDLEALFDRLGFTIDRVYTYTQQGRRLRMYGRAANLLAGAAIYGLRPSR